MAPTPFAILLLFAELSLLAFGGANAVLPEMRHQIVDVQGWLGPSEFVSLYALAQAAPGPNVMFVPLVGWHVAGLAGAAAAAIGQFVPSSILVVNVVRGLERFRGAGWYARLRRGIVPVTVGLVGAGAWSLVEVAARDAFSWVLIAASAALALNRRIHPLVVLFCGATLNLVRIRYL